MFLETNELEEVEYTINKCNLHRTFQGSSIVEGDLYTLPEVSDSVW